MYESKEAVAERNARYIPGRDMPDQMPKNATIQKPTLSLQMEQLGKVLAECHSIATNLENAVDRIVGPVPEAGEKTGPTPLPDSVTGRLEAEIRCAVSLSNRLSAACKRMNSAV